MSDVQNNVFGGSWVSIPYKFERKPRFYREMNGKVFLELVTTQFIPIPALPTKMLWFCRTPRNITLEHRNPSLQRRIQVKRASKTCSLSWIYNISHRYWKLNCTHNKLCVLYIWINIISLCIYYCNYSVISVNPVILCFFDK